MRSGYWLSRRFLAAALAALCAATPAEASPELARALNSVRVNGCLGLPGASPFRENAQLADAAKRLAQGTPPGDALNRVGYRATRHAMLQFHGDSDAKTIAGMAAAKSCTHLLDADMREIGIFQSLSQTWIVLAAPFSPPAPEDADSVAVRVLELVNESRAHPRACGDKTFLPARPLRLNARLGDASLGYAADMAKHGYIAHQGRDGSTPADRAARAGYQWRSVGENLASGPTTPKAAVDGWLSSPPHCANLMGAQFTEMGVGFSVNKASPGGIYWAQLFGTPR